DTGNDRGQIKALGFGDRFRSEDARHHYLIRSGQRLRQIVLQHVAAQGVGAWFENGPQTSPGIAGAQSLNGLGDSGGVVSKVVNDGDTLNLSFNFQSPLHAFESL